MTSFQILYSLASLGSVLSIVALILGDIEQAKILSVGSFLVAVITVISEKVFGSDDEF